MVGRDTFNQRLGYRKRWESVKVRSRFTGKENVLGFGRVKVEKVRR